MLPQGASCSSDWTPKQKQNNTQTFCLFKALKTEKTCISVFFVCIAAKASWGLNSWLSIQFEVATTKREIPTLNQPPPLLHSFTEWVKIRQQYSEVFKLTEWVKDRPLYVGPALLCCGPAKKIKCANGETTPFSAPTFYLFSCLTLRNRRNSSLSAAKNCKMQKITLFCGSKFLF